MFALRCVFLLAVLLSTADCRAKFGKLSLQHNREVNQRDYRTLSNAQPEQYVAPRQGVEPVQYVQPAQHIEPIPAVQLIQPVQPVEEPQPVVNAPQNVVPAESEGRQFHRQTLGQASRRPVVNNIPQNFLQRIVPQTPPRSTLIGARQVSYQNAGVPYQNVGVPYQTNPAPVVAPAVGYQPEVAAARPPAGTIASRLISNYTKIRENIVEGFSCAGRKYGYYADVANECQVFHVCFPLRDVFKNDPAVATVPDVTYIFSFICNAGTRFSQQALTCGWQYEVEPCEVAEQLYDPSNQDFFKIPEPKPDTGYPGQGAGPVGGAPLPGPVNVGGVPPVPGQVYPQPAVIRG